MHPQLGLRMRGFVSGVHEVQLRTKAGVKIKVTAIAKEEKNWAVENRRYKKNQNFQIVQEVWRQNFWWSELMSNR